MSSPTITVLMPAYNSARYLAEAIESILQQSFTDLQLVILDGGSSDPTVDIARAYAARDPRVGVEIHSGKHPTSRVDDFIQTVRSPYIAMQHSDDVSYQGRLARQMQAFADDPQLGVCSALARSFWHDRMTPPRAEGGAIHRRPEHHDAIKAELLFWWVMHAPTMMYDRQKIVEAGLKFSNPYKFCNDYWQSVDHIDKLKYRNIQQELSAYRMHFEGDGAQNREALQTEACALKQNILHRFGFAATQREIVIHAGLQLIPDRMIAAATPEEYDETVAWLNNLLAQNQVKGVFDKAYFTTLIEHLVQTVQQIQAARS